MKGVKGVLCGIIMTGLALLSACGAVTDGDMERPHTAQETAACVMESLKELDLERFNACTDNYVGTYHSWIGIPVEREYRVFNELLQPGTRFRKAKKKYEFNHRLAERMTEHLTWEIGEVREEKDRAWIDMTITNLDMTNVMGKYELTLLGDMLAGEGVGIGQLFHDLVNIMDEEEGLLAVVEECDEEDLFTCQVTATAFLEDGRWRLHLDDAFINAFMGNINAEVYSEEIERKLEELERQYEEELDKWADAYADEISDKIE
ncbi:MAG: hypothetical protein HFI58_01745 [Lachnospiraceae bacterium]|jgi:hypothetical protein|nr:hypothetical protein [Lachnospiraceae bacterium]MCI9253551.1 hypothetical protein [Lachnospiraceae bacterium]